MDFGPPPMNILAQQSVHQSPKRRCAAWRQANVIFAVQPSCAVIGLRDAGREMQFADLLSRSMSTTSLDITPAMLKSA
ncbi:hypothetical protein XI06_24130 [Bradyrhizobium sp. CCBAU 11434]|nr:hypothetical protein [Bradyrhizobium sp. CCBAU 11434]